VFGSLNSKSGLLVEGTKYIRDGEGRIRRLLRSKSWQNIAPEFEVDGPVDCNEFLSIASWYQQIITNIGLSGCHLNAVID
jgi:hypothetical protein